MKIIFYNKNNRPPVVDVIEDLESKDRAKILACLKCIEELSFYCPRVEFRQIKGRLWEVKIKTQNIGFRIFYVVIGGIMILLHAYSKQSHKAPLKEINLAEKRMLEVLNNEENYIE